MSARFVWSGPTFAKLRLQALDVEPLAAVIARVDWREHKTAFDAARWTGWCINGCGQASAGEFLLGYFYDRRHGGSQWFQEAEPLVSGLPGRIHAIRLFRLGPNTRVPPHVDSGEYYLERHWSEVRKIHIPIITNEHCCHSWLDIPGNEKTLRMLPGEAWYLNGNRPHGAMNLGSADRWHLVVDVDPTDGLLAICSETAA